MVQKCWLLGNSTDPERPAPAERVWKVRIARLSQKAMIQHTPTDCLTTSGVLPTIEPGQPKGMVQKCWLFGNSTDSERPAPAERVWKFRIARLSQKAMIQHTPTDCLTTSGVLPTIEPGQPKGMVQKCWLFGNSTDPERPAPAERVWKVRIARLSQKAMIQHTPADCLTTSGVLPTIEPGPNPG